MDWFLAAGFGNPIKNKIGNYVYSQSIAGKTICLVQEENIWRCFISVDEIGGFDDEAVEVKSEFKEDAFIGVMNKLDEILKSKRKKLNGRISEIRKRIDKTPERFKI